MATRLVTMKTTPTALQLLRLVAAATGETQYQLMERLCEAEWNKQFHVWQKKGIPHDKIPRPATRRSVRES